MKRFLLISLGLFSIALVASVVVFTLIVLRSQSVPFQEELVTSGEAVGGAMQELPTVITEKLGENGIPLTEIPLSEGQQKVLEVASIDVNNIVLTNEMVACAVERIGEERVLALMEGDVPGPVEMAKLTPCLGM